jgi:hypothetical protein
MGLRNTVKLADEATIGRDVEDIIGGGVSPAFGVLCLGQESHAEP